MAGTLTIDTLKASSGVLATQNGMTGIAKAWVNFNGSTGAIAGSFNVGSITVNGTGDYTVNFTTTMADANYAVAMSCLNYNSSAANTIVMGLNPNGAYPAAGQKNTSGVRVSAKIANTNNADTAYFASVAILGN